MTYTATEAKNKFGEVLENAYNSPVLISKNGKPTHAVITTAELEAFQATKKPIKNFNRLRELREELAKNKKCNEPVDIQDYYDGLDKKYGY